MSVVISSLFGVDFELYEINQYLIFFDFSNNFLNTSSSLFFVKSLFFNLSFGCFVRL